MMSSWAPWVHGAFFLIALTAVLAIARYWDAAFVLILGHTPLAVTFTITEIQGMVNTRGSGILIGIPVTIGPLLLVLHSNERLKLTSRPLAATISKLLSPSRGY